MAWTAFTNSPVTRDSATVTQAVEYRDSVTPANNFIETYRIEGAPPAGWPEESVRVRLDALNGQDTFTPLPDRTEIIPGPGPPPDNPALVALRANVGKLERAQILVSEGIMASSDARLVSLRGAISSALGAQWDEF